MCEAVVRYGAFDRMFRAWSRADEEKLDEGTVPTVTRSAPGLGMRPARAEGAAAAVAKVGAEVEVEVALPPAPAEVREPKPLRGEREEGGNRKSNPQVEGNSEVEVEGMQMAREASRWGVGIPVAADSPPEVDSPGPADNRAGRDSPDSPDAPASVDSPTPGPGAGTRGRKRSGPCPSGTPVAGCRSPPYAHGGRWR